MSKGHLNRCFVIRSTNGQNRSWLRHYTNNNWGGNLMILVTGGAGFVGGHIVERLAHRGEEVLVVDLAEPMKPVKTLWKPYKHNIYFEMADITDKTSIFQLMSQYRVDRVVHAATITSTPEMELENPDRVLHIGVVGSASVISAAIRHRVKRFVYLSSASIYEPVPDPVSVLNEQASIQQEGRLYPFTKVAGEWMTRYLSQLAGIEAVSGRITACYGPLERNTGARIVMSPVWKMVNRARTGLPLLIGSPDHILDFTYVKDIAEGIAELTFATDLGNDVYNISGGIGYTYWEMAEAVARMVPGIKILRTAPTEEGSLTVAGGTRSGRLDITRITRDTAFSPAYNLDAAIQDYTKWLETHEF